MRFVIWTAAVVAVTLLAASEPETAVLPDWMVGCWEARQGDRWTEECWTTSRAGMMLGSRRRGRGDALGEWEVMRIALAEPNGDGPTIRMSFSAAPEGRDWRLFAWTPGDEPGVAFVNAAHDCPQRIRYWREGRRLRARISLLDGSRAIEWDYAPIGAQ